MGKLRRSDRRTPPLEGTRAARLRAHLFERQDGACHYCGRAMVLREFAIRSEQLRPDDATIEHLVPRVLGGRDTRDNLVAACHECNRIGARIDKWCVDTFGRAVPQHQRPRTGRARAWR